MTTASYFRIKMLKSWAAALGTARLPDNWERVTAVHGNEDEKHCVVIIKAVADRKLRPAEVSVPLRLALDPTYYEGWLLTEAVSEQEALKILKGN
jgi:hypothetical protein